jgi:hypothetical protein
MNRKAAQNAAAETETSRHCSFSGDALRGIVLHSAKQRSTVFIDGERAHQFLALRYNLSRTQQDRLIESYF